ncbi:hypothetical protein MMC15_001734 [Xylographa vitiligo]|nr:hypothetical protein [Xylographa vitiligo]
MSLRQHAQPNPNIVCPGAPRPSHSHLPSATSQIIKTLEQRLDQLNGEISPKISRHNGFEDVDKFFNSLAGSNRINDRDFQLRRAIEAEREVQRLQREVQELTTNNEILRATTGITSVSHQVNEPFDDLNASNTSLEVLLKALGTPENPTRFNFSRVKHVPQTDLWTAGGHTPSTTIDQRLLVGETAKTTDFDWPSFNGNGHISDVPDSPEHIGASLDGDSQEIVELPQPGSAASLPNHPIDRQPRQSFAAAFKCDQCPKRFTRAFNLQSHLRTHADQRPFACTVCSRAFTRKHDLNNHFHVHSGAKNFECAGCGKRFARATALKRHSDSKTKRGCSAKHVQSDNSDTVSANESLLTLSSPPTTGS